MLENPIKGDGTLAALKRLDALLEYAVQQNAPQKTAGFRRAGRRQAIAKRRASARVNLKKRSASANS